MKTSIAITYAILAFATSVSTQAGTVERPKTTDHEPIVVSSDRPLINRPTAVDPFWEQQRRDGA
jgi:hypothetical protein